MNLLQKNIKPITGWLKRLYRLVKFGYINGLGSQTVNIDDIKIADYYLDKPDLFHDNKIICKYEDAFKKYNECKYAFSFSAGRAALSACIEALELREGDTVMIPAYTCVVVPNAFWFKKINIIFYDIELDTYGPSIEDLIKKWQPNVKAILIHHLFGLVACDYEKLIEFSIEKKVPVIEDCAHSTGARYKGKRVGNYGNLAFYSSEQSKAYSTFNGGLATTNDSSLAEKIQNYYNSRKYPSKERTRQLLLSFQYCYYTQKSALAYLLPGLYLKKYKDQVLLSTTTEEENFKPPVHYGQRLPSPLAAIGINQIKKLDKYNTLRNQKASSYNEWALNNGYRTPLVIDNSEPIFLRYPLLGNGNERHQKGFLSEELKASVGEWFLSYLHPVKYDVKGCPNASLAVINCFNLATL
jgi:dTDP-4-amino-4,6-dideoxygalactose transaminase